jgi:hypothetical protein
MKSGRRWVQAAWARCIAHAIRLDRAVAIKIVTETFSSDSDRLRRFQDEVRILST